MAGLKSINLQFNRNFVKITFSMEKESCACIGMNQTASDWEQSFAPPQFRIHFAIRKTFDRARSSFTLMQAAHCHSALDVRSENDKLLIRTESIEMWAPISSCTMRKIYFIVVAFSHPPEIHLFTIPDAESLPKHFCALISLLFFRSAVSGSSWWYQTGAEMGNAGIKLIAKQQRQPWR